MWAWNEFHCSRTKAKGTFYQTRYFSMDPSPRKGPVRWKQLFFWDGSNGKVVAPGVLVIYPINKKQLLLAPSIKILESNLNIFGPGGPWEPSRSTFSIQMSVLLLFRHGVTKSFFPPHKKNGTKTVTYDSKSAYWASYMSFWPIWRQARPNKCNQSA